MWCWCGVGGVDRANTLQQLGGGRADEVPVCVGGVLEMCWSSTTPTCSNVRFIQHDPNTTPALTGNLIAKSGGTLSTSESSSDASARDGRPRLLAAAARELATGPPRRVAPPAGRDVTRAAPRARDAATGCAWPLVLIQHNIARSTPTAPVRYEASHEQVPCSPFYRVCCHAGGAPASSSVFDGGSPESGAARRGELRAADGRAKAPRDDARARAAAVGARGCIRPPRSGGLHRAVRGAGCRRRGPPRPPPRPPPPRPPPPPPSRAVAAAAARTCARRPVAVRQRSPQRQLRGTRAAQRRGERSSVDDRSGGDSTRVVTARRRPPL